MPEQIRVLHVDDEPGFAEMVGEFLSREHDDLTVETVIQPDEAIHRLKNESVDCIVSDYEMPEMTGLELLEDVRETYPDLPFILFTGKGSEEIAGEAVSAGATDYLQKEGGTEQYVLLANRIRNAVGQYRAEQQKQETENRYRQLTENSLVPIVVYSAEGEIIYANTAAAEFFNAESPDQLLGHHARELAHPENTSLIQDRLQRMIENGEAVPPIEQRAVALDGELKYNLVTSAPISFGGEPAVQSIIVDTTEKRRQEDHLTTLAESFPDVAFIIDDTGRYVDNIAGPTSKDLLVASDGELLGKRLHDVMPDAKAEELLEVVQRTIATGQVQTHEYTIEIENTTKWFEGRVAPLQTPIDEQQGVVWVARDITEKKKQQQRLEQQQQLIETVSATFLDNTFIYNPEGVYLDVITGPGGGLDHFTEEELIGRSVDDLVNPDAAKIIQTGIDAAIETDDDEIQTIEYRLATPDGPEWYEAGIYQLPDGYEDTTAVVLSATEITERKQQQRKRERVISRVTDAIIEVDADWQFTLVNDQAQELYGITEGEVIGQSFWDVFDEAVDTRFEEICRDVMDSREPSSLVDRAPQVDGWFDIQLYPNDDRGIALYFRDITERRERQREREQIEARLRALAENFPNGGVHYFDEDLQYEYVAGDGFDAIETSPDDLEGKTIYEIESYNQDTIKSLESLMESTLSGHRETAELVYENRIYELRSVPRRDAEGSIEGGFFISQDVTQQRRRERILEELHAVATELPTLDNEKQVCERTVTAAESVLDFDNCIILMPENNQLQVVAISDEFPAPDFSSLPLEGNVAAETYRTKESYLVHNSQEHPTASPQGEYLSGISIPIGDHGVCQIVAEAEAAFDEDDLELAEHLVAHTTGALDRITRTRRLRERNERLDQFTSVVSHDLRSPLNVAQGNLDLLAEEISNDRIATISESLNRMEHLIDDLLTLAQEGDELNEVRPVDLETVTTAAWSQVETSAASLKIEDSQVIKADESRLRQLLANLFRNAIEHNQPEPTITIGTVDQGFYVADDGSGIPVEQREKVFEAGYTTKDTGTGFGLQIVEKIASAHNWEIEITDSDDDGARFEITGVQAVAHQEESQ